ncbi:hypothetical protein AC792_08810 [Arthrobacter sp. RIT-PI-e]|nr:hypothetical protein AC792_08810 [Arthrobacter sp. RIT-PI-e]
MLRGSLGALGAVVTPLLITWIAADALPGAPVVPAPSRAGQAQRDAEERYRALAGDARIVAGSPTAADPALAVRLGDLAADLEAQADAVAPPRPVEPSATEVPDDAAQAAPAPSVADVLQRLGDSAPISLLPAADADPGPPGVLAAAGAHPRRHPAPLAEALGTAPPLTPAGVFPADHLLTGTGMFADAAARLAADRTDSADQEDDGTADGAAGTAPADESLPDGSRSDAGTVSGKCADADRHALRTVRLAEEGARYAYEVAAARLPGERDALLGRSATHAAAAEEAGRRLAALCASSDPVPPGFALDAGFDTDAPAALGRLEQQHVELYAGSVPSAGRETRAWVIAELTAAVQWTAAAGSPLETFPGLGAPATDTPEAAVGGTDG